MANGMDWFDGGGNGQALDVRALLDSKAADMITEMLAAGALISMGLTSDGGALGVTVTVDGRWRREYFREAGQMELWTEEALAPVLAACDDRRASSVARTRTRSSRGR